METKKSVSGSFATNSAPICWGLTRRLRMLFLSQPLNIPYAGAHP
jgi:hypothetical protein